jgi:hypothetical protein
MTNSHRSATDWIVHRRVLNTSYPEHGRKYYRYRDAVTLHLNKHWPSMGLTQPEAMVLKEMLLLSKATWPWKFTLMGPASFSGNLFIVNDPVRFRRLTSSLRRKGFLNAGKVEQEGRGQWHGVPVQYPVLEMAPDLIRFCLGELYEFPVQDITLTGHLKVSKVKGRPCPNRPELGPLDYLYDGSVKSSLLYETDGYEGEERVLEVRSFRVPETRSSHWTGVPPEAPDPIWVKGFWGVGWGI